MVTTWGKHRPSGLTGVESPRALCQGKVHQREDSIGLRRWGNGLLRTRTMKWEQRKVIQGTSVKQPYPVSLWFKTYQWFHSGTEFGSSLSFSRAPSPPVTADVFSLASHSCLIPQHWNLGLPQPAMWFHGSGHGVGSYPCLNCLSWLSSIPCLCLLPLPLPKHMSSSHKLLHIPQDPLKDSLFSKAFILFPKLIGLCSQGLHISLLVDTQLSVCWMNVKRYTVLLTRMIV